MYDDADHETIAQNAKIHSINSDPTTRTKGFIDKNRPAYLVIFRKNYINPLNYIMYIESLETPYRGTLSQHELATGMNIKDVKQDYDSAWIRLSVPSLDKEKERELLHHSMISYIKRDTNTMPWVGICEYKSKIDNKEKQYSLILEKTRYVLQEVIQENVINVYEATPSDILFNSEASSSGV